MVTGIVILIPVIILIQTNEIERPEILIMRETIPVTIDMAKKLISKPYRDVSHTPGV